MTQAWNPLIEPYRVSKTLRSSQAGCYGWTSKVATFATLELAQAAYSAANGKNLKSVSLHVAENGENWSRIGRWRRIASRKACFRPDLPIA